MLEMLQLPTKLAEKFCPIHVEQALLKLLDNENYYTDTLACSKLLNKNCTDA